MKLGALFSGGKDSTYALYKAMKEHEIVCLIALKSLNPESYMFHVPAFEFIEKQAEALGIPLIVVETKGEKEKELEDLKKAIQEAKDKYEIEGIVTGAVASTYQASRIQKICDELGLKVFNPLWKINQMQLMKDLIKDKFEVIITGIAAYPLDESWLGRKLNENMLKDLEKLEKEYKINVAGEGGEFETLVVDSPIHKKRIELIETKKEYENHNGTLKIIKIVLNRKA
ncbi:diphthine--ammonia ligase [Candidatus Woesearchaeota archaeon]|nr:diphthine--ammonia ligase [Candidatus Woesearchaeota archaeon]